MEPSMEEKLRFNADLVVSKFKNLTEFPFAYDNRSVRWVDGFIERQREQGELQPEDIDGLVGTLGSYLGEAIIRCHGGSWSQTPDGGWSVRFDDKNFAHPFNKVRKQFANGDVDSIASFFESIPAVFHAVLKRDPSS